MNSRIKQQPEERRDAIAKLSDVIESNLSKVSALSAHTYGEGSGNGFRDMCDEYQDAYLWTMSEMIRSAKKAWDEMNELLIDIRKSPEAA